MFLIPYSLGWHSTEQGGDTVLVGDPSWRYLVGDVHYTVTFSGGSRKNERGVPNYERAARNFHFRSHMTRENPILSQGKSHNRLA